MANRSATATSSADTDDDQQHLRWAGLAGILAVVLWSVAFFINGPYPSAAASQSEVLAYVTRHPLGGVAQGVTASLGSPLIVCLGVSLALAYARGNRLTPAPILVGVGFTLFAVLIFSGATLFFSHIGYTVNSGEFNPEIVHVFMQATGIAGLMMCGFAALPFAATAVVNARRPILPTWLGTWAAGVIAVLNVVVVPATFGVTRGVMAPGSMLNTVPLQLDLFWILVAGVYLARGPRTKTLPSAVQT